jgi:uroporphyrinogen III methyltransferase/synthase
VPERVLGEALDADYVTFTSSSTVRHFLDAAADGDGRVGFAEGTRLISIGPVTSAALRDRGLQPHVEAARHDVEGVLDAILADAVSREPA